MSRMFSFDDTVSATLEYVRWLQDEDTGPEEYGSLIKKWGADTIKRIAQLYGKPT